MRSVLAAVLALAAAFGGGTVGILVAAWATGRLDLFRNPPGQTFFFIWGVRSDTGPRGVVWETVAALARAVGAFGAARLVLVPFAVRPSLALAVVLVVALLAWELRTLSVWGRAPVHVPTGIRSLHRFQAIARVVALVALAPVFIRL